MTTDDRNDILAEVRALLADVQAILNPPEPLESKAAISESMRELIREGRKETRSTFVAILNPMIDRLAYLLGLSEQERAFVRHAAEHPTDHVNLEVWADWLTDQQRPKDVETVRRLTPRTGDVIVYWYPNQQEAREGCMEAVNHITTHLRELGVEVIPLLMPAGQGWEVSTLDVEDGDVILVQSDGTGAYFTDPADVCVDLTNALAGRDVKCIHVPPNVSVAALDANLLAHEGLMRVADHDRALMRLNEELADEPEENEPGTLVTDQVLAMVTRLKRERQTVEQAVLAERERCARIASRTTWRRQHAPSIADEIRAGGEPEVLGLPPDSPPPPR